MNDQIDQATIPQIKVELDEQGNPVTKTEVTVQDKEVTGIPAVI